MVIRTDGTILRWTLKPLLDFKMIAQKTIAWTNFQPCLNFLYVLQMEKYHKYTNNKIIK